MKRIKKNILLGMAVLLLLHAFSITSYGKAKTVSIPYGDGENGYISVPNFLSDGESRTHRNYYSMKTEEEERIFPEKYDSRTEVNESGISISTAPRNQGSDETCWAFSVCSAAESSLIKKNFFNEPTRLSPLQFAYFTYNRRKNPLNISELDEIISTKNCLKTGGNEYLSVFALANWIGLTNEEILPYGHADELVENGIASKYCYAYNTAFLENAYWTQANQPEKVKQMVMEHGAAMISIYMTQLQGYNPFTYGYYNAESTFNPLTEVFKSNHMVTIVGWDDTYSRDNFPTAPEGDGAWLVKNSWGTNWGDGGYFWLSYYDKSIYSEWKGKTYGSTVTVLDMSPAGKWDNNYYYDGGGGINWYYFVDDFTEMPIQTAMMANVYEAQYEEVLEAVAFYTLQENVKYTINIYTDVDVSKSPSSGSPSSEATISGVLPFAGYHTIELPETVLLSPNTKYTIAIELDTQNSEEAVKLLADGSATWEWVSFDSAVLPQESYYKEPGKTWVDVTADSSAWYGNFRIKAFTSLVHKNLGDMDADGEITAKDALIGLQADCELLELSLWMEETGDVDKDKIITAKDALIILEKDVGIISEFPAEKGENYDQ